MKQSRLPTNSLSDLVDELDQEDRLCFHRLIKKYNSKRLNPLSIKIWIEITFFYILAFAAHRYIFIKILKNYPILKMNQFEIFYIYLALIFGIVISSSVLTQMNLTPWLWFLTLRDPNSKYKIYRSILDLNHKSNQNYLYASSIGYFNNAVIVESKLHEYKKFKPTLRDDTEVSEEDYFNLISSSLENYKVNLKDEDKKIFDRVSQLAFNYRIASLYSNFIFIVLTIVLLGEALMVFNILDFDIMISRSNIWKVLFLKLVYLLFLFSILSYLFFIYDYFRNNKLETIKWVIFNILRDESSIYKLTDESLTSHIEATFKKYNINNIISFNLMHFLIKLISVDKLERIPDHINSYATK